MATDESVAMETHIPHKFHKYRRLKERHDRIAAANAAGRTSPQIATTPPVERKLQIQMDVTSKDDDSKRCTGTQTSYSSFAEGHPPPPPNYPILKGLIVNPSNQQPPAHPCHEAPYNTYDRSRHSPPRAMDTDNVPLNLTVNNNNSVITNIRAYGQRPAPPEYSVSQAARKASASYDSELEEHFQRSLGRHYHGVSQPEPAAMRPAPSPSKPSASQVKVTQPGKASSAEGSVDDHFAKSLGETWTKIKEKNDPQNQGGTWSVDDHFAKALGDTWFRIKKSKESN
ncbi:hypothetical protein CAPTEDRAFT_226156 [Capitella teleta]|uniref:Transcription cofactor vestigial-like protein 4 n=1 Tax=Capitella teleta TaxID=283909 RepID=R7UU42_CAPTE|nr:hypothetical protein CAPTEDRAFT_226156 [Capitella teleta]|eukprot:ELU09700.1 hypothetical protein CAPTEDRAFT_226156 [Capitella teleta]